jgi:phosphatidylserine/phosphatidylglycerophosphate/cardiolipin synthase-like enzyme
MAKFLTTSHTTAHLEDLIKNANSWLILISPYLQFSPRIREDISYAYQKKVKIALIFRENNTESEWLSNFPFIDISRLSSLHAKCYINDTHAIITSMNLYQHSQDNNNEMGVLITKAEDEALYNSVLEECKRLKTISEKIKSNTRQDQRDKLYPKTEKKSTGYCIRTGTKIPFDVEKPLSPDAFKAWNKFADADYPEKYCHFSGEPSKGETSVNKPILKKNWKTAQKEHGL